MIDKYRQRSLHRRINLWKLIGVPFDWYNVIQSYAYGLLVRDVQDNWAVRPRLVYSIYQSICFHDRAYIDHCLPMIESDNSVESKIFSLSSIGSALYDLGYKLEGCKYLKESQCLFREHNAGALPITSLDACFRLNSREDWKVRLQFAMYLSSLDSEFHSLCKILLAKSYIDMKMFDEAKIIIRDIIDVGCEGGFLQGDLYFAREDYEAAIESYKRNPPHEMFHFWHPQLDYKNAASYYYLGKAKKWKAVADKMHRRMNWDRFYCLDFLAEEGVQRIKEIDQYLTCGHVSIPLMDMEYIHRLLKRTPRILGTYCWFYRYLILYYMAGFVFLVFLLMKIIQKYFLP